MRPLIHPQLVNDPFGDPGLFLEFMFRKRAMIFDLGDLTPLPPRKLLRVSDAFVSHAHMDHFSGFDRLLRLCLGRDKLLRVYGPPGFIDKVESRLASYSWNLVGRYTTNFGIRVVEVETDGTAQTAMFRCRDAFARVPGETIQVNDGVLLDEDGFRVSAVLLDHQIPSLAFSLEEKLHVNVWKNRLQEMGLGVGPWLRDLKDAVLRGDPDDTEIRATWRDGETVRDTTVLLGCVKREALRIVPGQKVTYVVDAVYHAENTRRIVDLARRSDYLFIEAVFLEEDAQRAAERYHLTARQAGTLAQMAGAQRVIPFHFSPRYSTEAERVRDEVFEAFEATGENPVAAARGAELEPSHGAIRRKSKTV